MSEAQKSPGQRSAEALVGQVVGGKYRVDRILGRGGMGTIYVAEQQPLGRQVALKVLHANLGDGGDPEFAKRFSLEAATLSQLAHPNIVVVHDYGALDEGGESCFMAMELLEGRTINQALSREGPFPPARALRITREIARALRAAHTKGVIHRDLKPANVMLIDGPEGESIKVLDFGLVKVMRDDSEELTAEGRFLGSPRYMAPEQIQRLEMDGRTDLYALGVILYRMLCGEVPFAGDHAVQTLMAHLGEPVPPIFERSGVRAPPAIEAMVMRLLEKEKEQRYDSADALIGAIDELWPSFSDQPIVMSGQHVRPAELTDPSLSASAPAESAEPPAPTPVSLSMHDAPVVATSAPGRGGNTKLVLAFIALLGLVAGGATTVLIVQQATPEPARVVEPSPEPAAPTVAVESPDEPPAPAEPAPPATFRLTIESEPSGATVSRDGEPVGETPLSLELEPGPLVERPATFTIRRPGHAPYVFTQGPSEEDRRVVGVLPRIPRRGRSEATSSEEGAGASAGIKTSR